MSKARKKSYRRILMLAAAMIISAAAVVYFVVQVGDGWADVWHSLTQANYGWVIPSIGALGLFYVFRIMRLRLFLSAAAPVSFRTAGSATLIGFMANCVLPLRVGEIIRPWVVARRSRVGFGEAAGIALGLERVFDLMGLAMLLAATLISLSLGGMPEPAEPAAGPPAGNAVALEHNTPAPANEAPPRAMSLDQIRRYGTVMAAVGLVGLAGIVLLAAVPGAMLKVGHFVLTPLPEAWRLTIMEFVESLISPMRFVRSPTRVGLGLLLTLLVWSATALATWLLSFGFGLRLSLSAVLVIQLAISVAVALPQAPSFLGLFQVGALTAARFYGIPNGEAAAFANVLWAVNVVPITVVGLVVLHTEGLSLRALAQQSEEAAEELEEEEEELMGSGPAE